MIATGAGVINADYWGVVFVLLFNHSDKDFEVKKGDRVAQLILERNATPSAEEVVDLGKTDRGQQGFSSTGESTLPKKLMEEWEEKEILIAMVGETEDGEEVWMATTKEIREEDEVWINTKTSNSIEFHLLHNEKKENFLLTEQIPTSSSTCLIRRRWIDSRVCESGTIRSSSKKASNPSHSKHTT